MCKLSLFVIVLLELFAGSVGWVNPRYAEITDQTCRGFRSSRTHSPTGLTGQTIVGDLRETQEAAVPSQQLQLCPAGRSTRHRSRLGTACPPHSDSCPGKPGAVRGACGLLRLRESQLLVTQVQKHRREYKRQDQYQN